MTTSSSHMRVAIIAATGYGGIELLRWLTAHPRVEIVAVSSEQSAGKRLAEVYPHLAGLDLVLQPAEDACGHGDVVFFATPNGTAMHLAPGVLARGGKVIDLSADFRLRDAAVFEKYYAMTHAAPDLLPEAVYGLPELYRDAVREARLIANPGCYPTSVLLALVPLLRAGLIEPRGIVVDSKSGVSGAGRTALQTPYLLAEANEDVSAYKVGSHRHQPEMEQQLTAAGVGEAVISFTPHLMPMTRGIFSTTYASLRAGVETADVFAIYRECYAGSPFVTVLDEHTLPHTKWCAGSNRAFLTARVDARLGRVVTLSAIDNLGKGMSGQAVQNMNLLCGFDEALGLDRPALYP
jgi:N-acetyl-gamma-glutamyl-phosphate reductase